jgi:hypothetical protein
MPETTIHMTCSPTHKALELRLMAGGNVRKSIVEETEENAEPPE